jgi:hypothetical protein
MVQGVLIKYSKGKGGSVIRSVRSSVANAFAEVEADGFTHDNLKFAVGSLRLYQP